MKKCIAFCIISWTFLGMASDAKAKIELSAEEIPSELYVDQYFQAKVIISGTNPQTPYYIRGAFYKADTNKYFGLTQNLEGVWKNYDTDHSEFFRIQGDGTYEISFQVDKTSSDFSSRESSYLFKIGRFTEGGSHTWSDSNPVEILIKSPDTTATPTISPTTAITSVPSPTPQFSQILIPGTITLSEIFPCQTSDQLEWIELYNSLDYEVDLTDWVIRDSTTTQKITFSHTFSPKSHKIIQIPTSLLNNSGDTVRLLDAQGQLFDQMSYSSCASTNSWIKHQNEWIQTQSITPNSSNILTAVSITPINTHKPSISSVTSSSTIDEIKENETNHSTHQDKKARNIVSYSLPQIITRSENIPTEQIHAPEAQPSPTKTHNRNWFALYSLVFSSVSHLASAGILYEKIHGFRV